MAMRINTLAVPRNTMNHRRPSSSPSASLPGSRDVTAFAGNENNAFVQGWLDVAGLVSGASSDESTNSLASRIGEEVYIDIASWHVYLRDVQKLHIAVAAAIRQEGYSRDTIAHILQRIPISCGNGKTQLSLFDCIPEPCIQDMVDLAEEDARR